MAIVFPASPSVNDTFTAGSITYKWDGDKWIGLGVTPADRLVEGSNSLELDANNDLVYTAPGTLKVNSADASGYIAEFNQTNTSNSGQILINSPTDGESRPVLLDMARAGNVQWSLGQGYLDTSDAFRISTTSLASGFTNTKFSISTDGVVDINKPTAAGLVVGGNGGGGDYHIEIGQLGTNGSGGINATGTSTSLKFQLNGSDIARFDNSGRLLVGNTSATINEAKIEAYADNTGNADVLCLYNKDTATGNTANILFAPSNSVAGARIICEAMEDFSTSANRTADLSFVTRQDGTLGEALRITSNKKIITDGSSVPADFTGTIYSASKYAQLGSSLIGRVPGSSNNNAEYVLLHKLGQGQGFQFAGDIIINSFTGCALIHCHITARYTDDNISYTVHHHSNPGIAKANIFLTTGTYNSNTWLLLRHNGGGTGVFYLNGFLNGNANNSGNGGLKAVTPSSIASPTDIVQLNN